MEYYKTKRIVDKKPPLRWVIVDETGKIINKNPSENELKGLKREILPPYTIGSKRTHKYNPTNTCPNIKKDGTICGNELIPQYTIREKDKNEKETGRWICRNCYCIEYNRDDYVERYKIGHRKTENLVYLNHIIGDNSLELACKLYGWEDLNKKYDNYKSPIDCYDPKTGLYHQVQGRCYYSVQGTWPFSGFKREWKKIFENMVCFCFSKDGKIVERIYKFLWEEIMRVTGITVFNNDNYHRYDKYKVIDKEEIKKVNDIWKEIIDKTK